MNGCNGVCECLEKEKDIWKRVKSNSPPLFLLRLPSPLWSFHNLEPSKLEGCRLALRRCVEARCQDVECLSTLSVLCLVVALSDCIIVSSYSGGELLLTGFRMSSSFRLSVSVIHLQ